MAQVDTINTAATGSVQTKDDDQSTLQTLAKMICTQRVADLADQIRKEIAQLSQRQKRVKFLHALLRAINAATDAKGNIDFSKSPELQKIREQGLEMMEEGKTLLSEAEALEKQAEALEAEATETGDSFLTSKANALRAEAKEKRDVAAELIDIGNVMDAASGKLTYTKDEKEKMIENIRTLCEDLNVINEMQLQTINRLTNERYESFQMAKSIMKPLHDLIVHQARSISR